MKPVYRALVFFGIGSASYYAWTYESRPDLPLPSAAINATVANKAEPPGASSKVRGSLTNAKAQSFLNQLTEVSRQEHPSIDEVESTFRDDIAEDPAALDAVLTFFRDDTDSKASKLLVIMLGLVQDPRVYQAAIDVARSPDKKAGLELIHRLGTPTDAMQEVVLKTLETETDPAVLSTAWFALRLDGTQDGARIVRVAKRDAQHSDIEVRRLALKALAATLDDQESFQVLVAALDHKSINIRGEAIKGIGRHPAFVDEGLIDRILEMVIGQSADKYLVLMAQETLPRLTLTESQKKQADAIIHTR